MSRCVSYNPDFLRRRDGCKDIHFFAKMSEERHKHEYIYMYISLDTDASPEAIIEQFESINLAGHASLKEIFIDVKLFFLIKFIPDFFTNIVLITRAYECIDYFDESCKYYDLTVVDVDSFNGNNV